MPAWRWTLYDPVDLLTYTFHLNPSEGGTPQYRKRITYQNTAAPGGLALIYEGQDEVQDIEWKGTILTEEHYDALVTWWNRRRQLQLTDHLSRSWWVYLQTFEPTQVRAATAPWKHTYSMKAVILSWVL